MEAIPFWIETGTSNNKANTKNTITEQNPNISNKRQPRGTSIN